MFLVGAPQVFFHSSWNGWNKAHSIRRWSPCWKKISLSSWDYLFLLWKLYDLFL